MFDPFSRSYRVARKRFREAARAAAAPIEHHPLAGQGPDGCALAIDVALVGARNPRRTVVVSSGLHGVEGFFGSAVQLAWLRLLRDGGATVPGATLVVLLHAVNPFGFAWRRRANEDNVDLNRNFLDDGETYTGVPRHYDRVHRLLNPPTAPVRLDPFRLRAAWAVRRHGLSVLQTAVASGQYEHPSGLFFGGREAAASTRLVQARFWDWTRDAEDVVHLDLHTGLGKYTGCQLLVEPPQTADLGWYRALFDPERVVAVGDGTPYAARGVMGAWLARHAGARRYRSACLEFGTYPALRVLAALRAENRAHHHSSPGAPACGRAKRRLVECFCPASRFWRRKALGARAGGHRTSGDGCCLSIKRLAAPSPSSQVRRLGALDGVDDQRAQAADVLLDVVDADVDVAGSFEELRPGAPEEASEVLIPISAAFDVDHRAHQRLPPSSPELQSSPRLYFSNQAFSLVPSRRSNCDSPFFFSQTTTLDGWSVRASTSMREWVVTTICARRDACTSDFATIATTSG